MEAECRYCTNLAPNPDPAEFLLDGDGMPPWRCIYGRFDTQHEGSRFRRWFAWKVIFFQLDPAVKAAEKDCPRFQVHPQAGGFTEEGRVLSWQE